MVNNENHRSRYSFFFDRMKKIHEKTALSYYEAESIIELAIRSDIMTSDEGKYVLWFLQKSVNDSKNIQEDIELV